MRKRTLAGSLFGLLLVGDFTAVWQLQEKIDREQAAIQTAQNELLLRSPSLVKKLSLEYAPLLAALYWTRAVQYYGEKHRLHDPDLSLLWPLLDITTTLDPNLIPPYRFGSVFLSDKPPRGAGEPKQAVQLIERGIRANPGEWRLYQDLGNVYYFDMRDYPRAAKAFRQGSQNPKAYIWMKAMAAKIAEEGESPETSYFLWQEVYLTTTDAAVKKNAEEHMELLQVELDLRGINRIAEQYLKRTGQRAARISELEQAGFLPALPKDPAGYPYVLSPDGKAELNPDSPLREKRTAENR